jgi:uncharacterized protein
VLNAFAVVIVVGVGSVADVPNPRPDGWVSDQANVLEAGDEKRLDELAAAINRERGIELAIVAIDDSPGSAKQFATDLFNHWKIGSAATDNGVLVLLVMGKRRIEVETGTGIEAALPAAWLADMQARDMVPRFKRKDFAGGLVAGVEAIVAHLRAAPGESPTGSGGSGEYRDDGTVVTPPAPSLPQSSPNDQVPYPSEQVGTIEPRGGGGGDFPIGGAVAGGAGLLGAAGGGFLIARTRRKRRTCETCQPPRRMLPLDEIADDAHLSDGQKTEERVGSVDYEVVVCPGCQASRVIRHGKWFRGYSRCPSCDFKTERESSVTLVHATYDHGGQVEVTETCAHCNRHHTYIRHTARRTRPSSSSGGSRSSFSSGGGSRSSGFGGGSSRGGGAGSSW